MRSGLIAVDLQRAFLDDARLEPAAGGLLAGVSAWLERFRSEGRPVLHVRTTVSADGRDALPHWDAERIRQFTAGATGWEFAPEASPREGEPIVEKTHYSGFESVQLEELIREAGADQLVLIGVHLHGCIRSTALDATAAGFRVSIASDATASNDPPHAAATQRWMRERAFPFTEVADWAEKAPEPEPATPRKLRRPPEWAALGWERRAAVLEPLAARLRERATQLAEAMAAEIHKPVRDGLLETEYAASLAEHALARGAPAAEEGADGLARRVAHGVALLITPWNNPVAIPVGKIVPALAHGNTAIWKPSPHCAGVSTALEDLLIGLDLPDGVLERREGGAPEVSALLAGGGADAVSLTGSLAAGRALQDLCAARLIPLQAELGGNNAAIVAADADVEAIGRRAHRRRPLLRRAALYCHPAGDPGGRRPRPARRGAERPVPSAAPGRSPFGRDHLRPRALASGGRAD